MTTTAGEHLDLSIEAAAERPCVGRTLMCDPRVRGAVSARPSPPGPTTCAPLRRRLTKFAGTSQDTAVTPLATRPCLGSRQIAGARCRQFGQVEGPAQESADAPVSISRHFHCLLA